MRKEYPYKPPEDCFARFSSVVDGNPVHFGVRFATLEKTQEFSKTFQQALQILTSS